MPARAKGKTPGRPARKSTRQGNDSMLTLPGTPGWQPATSDMFASPSFTPPQSPPRSRQVRGGRVTKSKADPKSRKSTLVAAAKAATSPALTRRRRATMLPSELVTFKSPPSTRRRASIYQKPRGKGAAAADFKMPDPVAIMRAGSRKKSPQAKKASPKKVQSKPAAKSPAQQTTKKAPVVKAPVEKSPAKTSPAKKSPVRKSPAKKSPVRKSPAKKLPVRKSPAKRSSPKKSPAKKQTTIEEKTPKKITRTRTPQIKSPAPAEDSRESKNALVTPSNVSSGSIKKGRSTGRATRSAKQVKESPKLSSAQKASPASSKSTRRISLKRKSIKTPRDLRNLTDSNVSNSSVYSSPKAGTPAKKSPKGKKTVVKETTPITTLITPINKPVERLRAMGSESAKKVRILSEKSDSLTKVYRKTPSRGSSVKTAIRTTEVTESTTGTPIKAARILGKTPLALASGRKLPVKPKILVESLVSPKTSTPVELRKRRAEFPQPVSEIRQSKRIALEATRNDESSVAEMTADMSVARPEDVRSSWWGWCNIM